MRVKRVGGEAGPADDRGRADDDDRAQPEPPASTRRHPRLDSREAVAGGGDGVGLANQRAAQQLLEAAVGIAGEGHDECSRRSRRALTPREAWLFTAPVLMPIASAIWASERST